MKVKILMIKMILSIPLSTYNNQFVALLPSVKNNMMEHGLFIRILYSPTNITFNGIFVHIMNEKMADVYKIEKQVLQTYHTTKQPIFSIEKQLHRYSSKTILKISGIWENDTSYGLAYKIIN